MSAVLCCIAWLVGLQVTKNVSMLMQQPTANIFDYVFDPVLAG